MPEKKAAAKKKASAKKVSGKDALKAPKTKKVTKSQGKAHETKVAEVVAIKSSPAKKPQRKQVAKTPGAAGPAKKPVIVPVANMDASDHPKERIRQYFAENYPEVLTEGRVDLDVLKDVLGELVDEEEERYRFTWNGKSRARQMAQTPSTGTLRPCSEESLYWETTQNLFIEGDNLEVLKLLQKSLHKKVKVIYIDPPYNTGKDRIYVDDFRDNIQNYMEMTGQLDEKGRRLSVNIETSGRYHTNWLNMMYPRLKLARNLLRDDGVIFISVDDIELANLKKICDEVFGDEGFVGIFPWRSRTAKADVPFGISVDVEWVVAYAKPSFIAGRMGKRKYHKTDDYDDRWRTQDITTNKTREERPNSYFTMINPRNGDQYPASETRTWSVTIDTFPDYYAAGKIIFPGDYDFLDISIPAFRVFEEEDKKKASDKYGTEDVIMPVSTYLPEKDVKRTEHGTKEIRELFSQQVFSYPKPTALIKFFIEITRDPNAIVVDFFAGSSTTADAVFQLNMSDGGFRRYIMVQLPEPLDPSKNEEKAGADYCKAHKLPLRISELSKERIRLAVKGIEAAGKADGKNGSKRSGRKPKKEQGLDLGFKVFKLDSSNIKPWDADYDDLESTLSDAVENIKTDRSDTDVLYELLLKYGIDLAVQITKRDIANTTVYVVGLGELVVCLADSINLAVVEGIAELREELDSRTMRVVFKDNGFADDVVKTNAVQILNQGGIDDVKSL